VLRTQSMVWHFVRHPIHHERMWCTPIPWVVNMNWTDVVKIRCGQVDLAIWLEELSRRKENFLLNNQRDALIIPILFCYKTLHVSGIFSAHHQEFSTLHSALISFMQVSDDRFQAESGWNCSSILTVHSWVRNVAIEL